MSTELDGNEVEGKDDPLKNVKAEFDRKLSNVEGKLDSMTQAQQATMEALQQLVSQGQVKPAEVDSTSDELGQMIVNDPKAAVNKITQTITKQVTDRVMQENQANNSKSQELARIIQDFPELGDKDSAMTKRTVEIYSRMPKNERDNPAAYRAATLEAAMELGLKPRSKRGSSDDYQMGAGNPSDEGRRESKASSKDFETTLAFAAAMGMDVSDEKVVKRLKQHSKRQFNRWE